MSENRVLRRIFESKTGEVTGEWRKLRNEEIRRLYSSPITIRAIKRIRIRWAVYVARTEELMKAYRIVIGKYKMKRSFEGVG
jgi:hypothetical protein